MSAVAEKAPKPDNQNGYISLDERVAAILQAEQTNSPEEAKSVEDLIRNDPLFYIAGMLRTAAQTPAEQQLVDISWKGLDIWRKSWQLLVARERLVDEKKVIESDPSEVIQQARIGADR